MCLVIYIPDQQEKNTDVETDEILNNELGPVSRNEQKFFNLGHQTFSSFFSQIPIMVDSFS